MPVLQLGNQLALISFSPLAKHLQGISLRDVPTHHWFLPGSQFHHLLFNDRQVGLLDGRLARIHVIIETVLNGGTYAELDARI